MDRQRRLPRTVRRRPDAGTRADLVEYAGWFRAVYAAAQHVSGARVLVDSSKEIPTAVTLSHLDDLDLRVLHIVRDARGVAHSWAKVVARPEADGEPMPRFSPARSTALWMSGNLTVQGLAWRGTPLTRMRDQDLVAAPAQAVARAWWAPGAAGASPRCRWSRTTASRCGRATRSPATRCGSAPGSPSCARTRRGAPRCRAATGVW